jgi:hypothetical protein
LNQEEYQHCHKKNDLSTNRNVITGESAKKAIVWINDGDDEKRAELSKQVSRSVCAPLTSKIYVYIYHMLVGDRNGHTFVQKGKRIAIACKKALVLSIHIAVAARFS